LPKGSTILALRRDRLTLFGFPSFGLAIWTAIDAFAALVQPTRLEAFRLLVRIGPKGLPALEISRLQGTKTSTLSGLVSILKRAGVLKRPTINVKSTTRLILQMGTRSSSS